MAENARSYTSNVLGTIRWDAAHIGNIASTVGVSPLAIAAPIARAMNKTEVGDGRPWSPLYENLVQGRILNYRAETSPITGEQVYLPITHDDIAKDYEYVRANRITNIT